MPVQRLLRIRLVALLLVAQLAVQLVLLLVLYRVMSGKAHCRGPLLALLVVLLAVVLRAACKALSRHLWRKRLVGQRAVPQLRPLQVGILALPRWLVVLPAGLRANCLLR